jgi:hypothetical protein
MCFLGTTTAFVGLCLGIAGLLRRGRRKGFAVAGVVINALFVLALAVALFVLT